MEAGRGESDSRLGSGAEVDEVEATSRAKTGRSDLPVAESGARGGRIIGGR